MFKIFKLVPSLIVVGILIAVIYIFFSGSDYELKELLSLSPFLQFLVGYIIVSIIGFIMVALDIGKDTDKKTREKILQLKKNHKRINGRHGGDKLSKVFYSNVDEITFFDKLIFEHGRPLDIDNFSEFEHGVVYYFFLIQWMGFCTLVAIMLVIGIPIIIIGGISGIISGIIN